MNRQQELLFNENEKHALRRSLQFPDLSPSRRRLLRVLLEQVQVRVAGSICQGRPVQLSIDQVARMIDASRATAQRTVDLAKSLGLLRVDANFQFGVRLPNSYSLDWNRIAHRARGTPVGGAVDEAPTHADEAPTHADEAPTHADEAPTHADEAPTHADEVSRQVLVDNPNTLLLPLSPSSAAVVDQPRTEEEKEDWDEIAEELSGLGVVTAAAAVHAARSRPGANVEIIRAVIAHYRASPNAWSESYLAWRVRNQDPCGKPDVGWPTPREVPRVRAPPDNTAQRAEHQHAQQDYQRATDYRQQLEANYGEKLNQLSTDQRDLLATLCDSDTRKAYAQNSNWVRQELLEALARSTEAKDT